MSGAALLLGDADRRALLDAVQRFAGAELNALAARPEQAMDRAQLRQALAQLVGQGLVNTQPEAACGLWDAPADASLRRFAVEALMLLARVVPAVAYEAHCMALGAQLDRMHAVAGTHSVVALDGRWGIGRRALARALAGADLTADDALWLADCWAAPTPEQPDASRVLIASADWQAAWWPQWTAAQGWCWCRAARNDLAVHEHARQHGFDELSLQRIARHAAASAPDARIDAHDDGAVRLIEIATLHGLGLLAITVGATQRAIARARAFAQLRRQGGQAIIRHAAVQQLLAEAGHAVWCAQAALATLQAQPPGLSALHAVWRARARLQPQLSDAASHALQVFGGMGYMRDTGAEKDLRDVNTLRQLGGSPAELTLCCAALDGLIGEVTA